MDSRKPLSNISNNLCCRVVVAEEPSLSSKDCIFVSKNEEELCAEEQPQDFRNSAGCQHNNKKQREPDIDENECERVAHYLRFLFEAKSKMDVLEEGSLNRTTSKFSWPISVISKSKRKKSLHRRTIDGKQILYRAYENPKRLIFPDGVTTWRHFV
ncbi:hypothetical protein GpartN1_g7202.t1 [Galdieria partita]|uniref:Uncharacterized protein n=1 Tax=Galdieria partita TaxID=83374 RepID=A0A9C7Q385_9RHOD|nr:hypothetical protein GpartN1_g7202.t1 [Galdieria partita]